VPDLGDDLTAPGWIPPRLDTGVATSARMYDYFLGGKDNFPADRAAAEQLLQVVPEARANARANRAFLGRALRTLVDDGLTQFLDIGIGLPGPGGTVETVRSVCPEARIVGVDNDPIVLAHARARPSDIAPATIVTADLRDPEALLANPEIRAVIDFDRPVVILLVAILHFIGEPDAPHAIVRKLMDAAAPGSCLVVSHATGDSDPVRIGATVDAYDKSTTSLALRPVEEVTRFFDGLDLLEPGLVRLPEWRPGGDLPEGPDKIWIHCGVGRKG
jgi:trans-aconitate methyltransferase